MKIALHTLFENIELVWADSTKLDDLWKLDPTDYIAVWEGEARDIWFRPRESRDAFLVPVLSINFENDVPPISFSNGRHRTRWLISNMKSREIPIGVHSNMIDRGLATGLLLRRVADGEEILTDSTIC
jgi:hypothetical protein